MLNLGSMYVTLWAKTDAFQAEMAAASRTLQNFGAGGFRFGRFATRWIGVPMMVASGSVLKFSKDFQEAFELTNAMLKTSGGVSDAFKENILGLSDVYGKAATDIMKASYKVTSVFQTNAQDTARFVEQIVRGAVAGKLTAVQTAEAIVNVMATYGYSVEKAAYITDVLAQAVKLGNAEWKHMAIQLPRVAGIAQPLGASFYELAGAYAYMSGRAGTTQQAGTALLNLMGAMLNRTPAMAKAIRHIGEQWGMQGVTMARTLVKAKGLQATFAAMANYIGRDTNKLTQMIPTLRGLAGAQQLLTNDAREYIDVMKEMGGYMGETERQMKAQAGWAYQLDRTWERLKNTGIRFVEAIMPGVLKLTEYVDKISLAFSRLDRQMQAILGWGALFVTVAPIVGMFFGAFINNMGWLWGLIGKVSIWLYRFGGFILACAGNFQIFTTAIATAASWIWTGLLPTLAPILAVAAALIAVAGAFVRAIGRGDTWAKRIRSTFSTIGAWTTTLPGKLWRALKLIVGFFWNFGENVSRIFVWVRDNWESIIKDIGVASLVAITNLGRNFLIIGEKLAEVSVIFSTWVTDQIPGIMKLIRDKILKGGLLKDYFMFFYRVGNAIWEGWKAGLEAVSEMEIGAWFDGIISRLLDSAAYDTGDGLVERLMRMDWSKGWVGLLEGFKATTPKLVLEFRSFLDDWEAALKKFRWGWGESAAATKEEEEAIEDVGRALDGLWKGSEAALKGTVAAATIIAQSKGNRWAKQVAEQAKQEKATQDAVRAFNTAYGKYRNTAGGIMSGISKVPAEIISVGTSVIERSAQSIGNAVTSFANTVVTDMINGVHQVEKAVKETRRITKGIADGVVEDMFNFGFSKGIYPDSPGPGNWLPPLPNKGYPWDGWEESEHPAGWSEQHGRKTGFEPPTDVNPAWVAKAIEQAVFKPLADFGVGLRKLNEPAKQEAAEKETKQALQSILRAVQDVGRNIFIMGDK